MKIRRLMVLFSLGVVLAVPPLGCKAKTTYEGIKSPDVPHDVMVAFKKYMKPRQTEKFTAFMLNMGFQSIEVGGELKWADKYGNELPPEAIARDYNNFLRIELERFAQARAPQHKSAD
jgi:hypothetical protein